MAVFTKINKKGDLINLEQQINICRHENMSAEKYEPESKNLLALSVLMYYQSRGLEQSIEINEKNQKYFNLGKKLYLTFKIFLTSEKLLVTME